MHLRNLPSALLFQLLLTLIGTPAHAMDVTLNGPEGSSHFGQWLHVLSTGGAWLLGTSIVLALGHLLLALKWGPVAPSNPWNSRSFEWLTSSPPPKHNFFETPNLDYSPYDYTLTEEEARARAAKR